jgi:hypothetical protein
MTPFTSLKSLILKHVEKPIIKFFLFSIFDTFVGALGMLLYGIFTSTYGPVWIRNQFFGLWLTTFIFYIGLQSIYIEIKTWNKKFIYFYDLVYFILLIIIFFLMIIFYGMAKRIDAIIWSIYIFAVCITNVYILYARRSSLIKKTEAEPQTNQQETLKLNTNPSELEPTQARSKLKSCLIMTLRVVNVILRFFFLLFACFLLAGAIVEGVGIAKYPARGKFADVNYGDGRTIKVHYLCDGPVNDNLPVIMFEGDGSHGLLDYLSLQKLLKENNYNEDENDDDGDEEDIEDLGSEYDYQNDEEDLVDLDEDASFLDMVADDDLNSSESQETQEIKKSNKTSSNANNPSLKANNKNNDRKSRELQGNNIAKISEINKETDNKTAYSPKLPKNARRVLFADEVDSQN